VKFDYAVISADEIKKTIISSDSDYRSSSSRMRALCAGDLPETRKDCVCGLRTPRSYRVEAAGDGCGDSGVLRGARGAIQDREQIKDAHILDHLEGRRGRADRCPPPSAKAESVEPVAGRAKFADLRRSIRKTPARRTRRRAAADPDRGSRPGVWQGGDGALNPRPDLRPGESRRRSTTSPDQPRRFPPRTKPLATTSKGSDRQDSRTAEGRRRRSSSSPSSLRPRRRRMAWRRPPLRTECTRSRPTNWPRMAWSAASRMRPRCWAGVYPPIRAPARRGETGDGLALFQVWMFEDGARSGIACLQDTASGGPNRRAKARPAAAAQTNKLDDRAEAFERPEVRPRRR